MSSVEEDSLLKRFCNWLSSRDGGSKNERQGHKHKRTVQNVVRYNENKIDYRNLYDRKFINGWLSSGTSKKMTNGTLKTYLGSVQHFLKFVIVTEQEVYDYQKIKKFKPILKAWKRDLWKGIEERKHVKNLEDLHRFPEPDDMTKLDSSKAESVDLLKMLSSKQCTLTQQTFCKVRDYLLTYALLSNASRPSAISNMTLEEFELADRQDDGFVVSVKKHKNSYKGPAHLAFSKELYENASAYIRNIRNKLPGISTNKTDPVFVSWGGLKMDSSLVTTQFNTFWSVAVGKKSSARAINPTIVRKYTTTLIHDRHNDFKQDTANHLCHSLGVADKDYTIIDKQKRAAAVSRRIHDIQSAKNVVSNKNIYDIFQEEITKASICKADVISKIFELPSFVSLQNDKGVKKSVRCNSISYCKKSKRRNQN